MSTPYSILERSGKPLKQFNFSDRERSALRRLVKTPEMKGNGWDDYVLRIVGGRLQAGKYIGCVELCRGSRIEILPKLADKPEDIDKAKSAAMRMIRSVYQLDSKTAQPADLEKSGLDIYELLIQMYIKELTRVMKKGLRSGYVREEDNLTCYKGKLIFSEHIRRNSAHRERFYVSYDVFSPNRPENRLLKSTALLLLDVSASSVNRTHLRQLLAMMEDIEPSRNIEKDFASVVDDRTTSDYRSLLDWSRFFLHRHSFDAFSGRETARSLLIPVEMLFEKYVGRYLRKTFSKNGTVVKEQDSRFYLAPASKNNNHPYFNIRPDFVIESGSKTLILDTKWKLLNDKRFPNFGIVPKDMYQMLAYARTYKASDVCLIYPKPLGQSVKSIPKCFTLPDDVRVHIAFVDFQKTAEEDIFTMTAKTINDIIYHEEETNEP